ncbi:hypothetical protein NDU88_005472 [Pleurodeles waltl]|uniref:Uncharacterized protein n=1 Tax=Pleurodeles waltl TaxID=8319 RepID=A0AAV7MWE5_PLEWA|nr:hypothetical protein NDU88_005472 [Pleurodeles waltl]
MPPGAAGRLLGLCAEWRSRARTENRNGGAPAPQITPEAGAQPLLTFWGSGAAASLGPMWCRALPADAH